MTRFDDILIQLGEFGPYQKRVYVLVALTAQFAAMHKMAWVFLAALPDHRCVLPTDGPNATYQLPESVLNASIPWDSVANKWSQCYRYVNGSNRHQQEACHRWIYDTSEYRSSVVTQLDLVCERNWMRALLQSMNFLGECSGSIFVSFLSDRIGRKKSLLLSLVGQGISGIAWAYVDNYYGMLIVRILIGLFSQGIFLVGFVLAVEFVGISKRVLAGSFINYFFALGYLIVAGIAYLLRDWQHLELAISVPPLVYTVALIWAPESARWLIRRNRQSEATKILHKAAKINKKSLHDIVLKEETETSVPLNLGAIFRNFTIMYKVLVMCYTWFVVNATYYGLSLNTSNLGGNDFVNFLIAALLEFPAYTVAIFAMQYLGRRFPVCISMFIGGLALLATIVVPQSMISLTVTLAMIGKFGVTVAYAIIYVYAVEIYPTNIRNGALGVNSTFARAGGIMSSYILLLGEHWRPLPLVILGSMSVSVGVLILLLPNTQNKALPETFEDASSLLMKPVKPDKVNSEDTNANQ